MRLLRNALSSTLVALILSACGVFSERGGELVFLETTIEFKSQGGEAFSEATVYIGERIGSIILTTAIDKTDSLGRIRIKGFRCLPLIVAVDGGSAVINSSDSAKAFYSILVMPSGGRADALLGELRSKYANYAEVHGSCG